MIIGSVRPEEAVAFDSRAGYHAFMDEFDVEYGSFEIFWLNDGERPVGWYWWACFPGCLPDGEANGPFASSIEAYYDAIDA